MIKLQIESTGSKNVGRCLNEHYYEITSDRPLMHKEIAELYKLSFHSGQTYKLISSEVIESTAEKFKLQPDQRLRKWIVDENSKRPASQRSFLYKVAVMCDSSG